VTERVRYDVDNVALKSILGRESVLVDMLNARGRDGWRLAATIPVGTGGVFPSAGGTLLVWERPDTA
jgi:hypothetical protein